MYNNILNHFIQSNLIRNKELIGLLQKTSLIPYNLQKNKNEQYNYQYLEQALTYTENFYGNLNQFGQSSKIKMENLFQSYWCYIYPFYLDFMKEREQQERSAVCGLLGVQGAGKTTFGSILNLIAQHNNKSVLSVSIDDFYLIYEKRKQIRQLDPRIRWRGPPGTHDLTLLKKLFYRVFDNKYPLKVPQFDKSLHGGEGDVSGYLTINQRPDIIVLEGWFAGLKHYSNHQDLIKKFVYPINTPEDQKFALDMNDQLKAYEDVWNYFDRFIILTPEDYNYSKMWRLEAEHKMKAIKGPNHGMSDQQIDEFVNYFWKALHPKIFVEDAKKSGNADLTVILDKQHKIKSFII